MPAAPPAAAAPPALARRSITKALKFGIAFVTVRVGKSAAEFTVHELLLRDGSMFFDLALKGPWEEAQKKLVTLPDDIPETFMIYQHWLYSVNILTQHEDDTAGETTEAGVKTLTHPEWSRLKRCYIFGDKVQNLDFKDAVVDRMQEKEKEMTVHFNDYHDYIYPYSTQTSPARMLAVDTAIFNWPVTKFESLKKKVHPEEFVQDLAIRFAKIQATPSLKVDPRKRGACYFHEHTKTGKPCYKTKWGA